MSRFAIAKQPPPEIADNGTVRMGGFHGTCQAIGCAVPHAHVLVHHIAHLFLC